jgi:hypothetical protein
MLAIDHALNSSGSEKRLAAALRSSKALISSAINTINFSGSCSFVAASQIAFQSRFSPNMMVPPEPYRINSSWNEVRRAPSQIVMSGESKAS